MSFMTDNDLALRILRRAEKSLVFKDYGSLLYSANLRYFQGHLETELPYFSYLDGLMLVAREHQQTINRAENRCSATNSCKVLETAIKSLRERARRAELQAINVAAYYIAEDLARDVKAAVSFQPLLEEYASEIYKAIQLKEDEANKHAYLDTYAYASLVLEARKVSPDVEKFKRLTFILEGVVANLELELMRSPPSSRIDLTELNIARTHLATARDLATQ
jgi:hypothetical protein